jgi:hypothetical protein
MSSPNLAPFADQMSWVSGSFAIASSPESALYEAADAALRAGDPSASAVPFRGMGMTAYLSPVTPGHT